MRKLNCNNHPLLRDGRGLSERQLALLAPETVQLDDRSLEDWLVFIAQFAQQVNHHNEQLEITDWTSFFEQSIPVQIALIGRFDYQKMRRNYEALATQAEKAQNFQSLNDLMDFTFDQLFQIELWVQRLQREESPMLTLLRNLIDSNLKEVLAQNIAYANAANQWNYRPKRNHAIFNANWKLSPMTLFQVDAELANSLDSTERRVQKGIEKLNASFQVIFNVYKEVVQQAADLVTKSMTAKADHEPHLGLIYAFLNLLGDFQKELNGFSKRHLDFFYQHVLKLKKLPPQSDEAHLIFELNNKIEQLLLDQNTLFKAGKDESGSEIQFSLDRQIIVDTTKVAQLKTLYLNTTDCGGACDVVKSVHWSPMANSADGLGEDFPKGITPSWKTLGFAESKWLISSKNTAYFQAHPFANFGFMVASPILLLQEGKRTITWTIDLNVSKVAQPFNAVEFDNALQATYSILTEDDLTEFVENGMNEKVAAYFQPFLGMAKTEEQWRKIFDNRKPALFRKDGLNGKDWLAFDKRSKTVAKPFQLFLSGAKEWLPVFPDTIKFEENKLTIAVELDKTFPPITHYDPQIFGVEYGVEMPVMQAFLNPTITYKNEKNEGCSMSLYHTFRGLEIEQMELCVDVQDSRNLIAQNETGLLDVSQPFMPFGAIPKVGETFLVGSDEIFRKNVTDLDIHIVWEGLPKCFTEYYQGYFDPETDFDNETSDQYTVDIFGLKNGEFKERISNDKTLFPLKGSSKDKINTTDGLSKKTFPLNPLNSAKTCESASDETTGFLKYSSRLTGQPLTAFKAGSTNAGFLKFKLNKDFKHDEFGQVMGRQMLALAKQLEDKSVRVNQAVYLIDKNSEGFKAIEKILDPTTNDLAFGSKNIENQLEGLKTTFEAEKEKLTFPLSDFFGQSNKVQHPPNPVNQKLLNNAKKFPSHSTSLINLFNSLYFKNTEIDKQIDDTIKQLNEIKSGVNKASEDFKSPNNPYPNTTKKIAFIKHEIDKRISELKDLKSKFSALEKDFIPIPNPPITPTAKDLYANYTAIACHEDLTFFHLHPAAQSFKKVKLPVAESLVRPTLLENVTDEGTLYIGLENLKPGSNLNLLFQMLEYTANPDLRQAKVTWQYLKNNRWETLRPGFEILDDRTNGLINSGIIQFSIPFDINSKNTVLPKDLFWLKVSTKRRSAAIAETIAVFAQAEKATFLPQNNDLTRLANPLESESVAKPVIDIPALKSVVQPFPTFGGRAPESDQQFYQRISERLRHKGRGINLYDYEVLILQAFPEIFKVKCLTHTLGRKNQAADYELAPGFVAIAVIPNVAKLDFAGNLTPKATLATLVKIEKFLKKRCSPFLRLKVLNPRYEAVNVKAEIRFGEGLNETFYLKQLQQDVEIFLAPWIANENNQLSFGGKISKSAIIKFMENLPYIQYLKNVEIRSQGVEPLEEIIPLTARSILTSGQHTFAAIAPDSQHFNQRNEQMQGLGYETVGSDAWRLNAET